MQSQSNNFRQTQLDDDDGDEADDGDVGRGWWREYHIGPEQSCERKEMRELNGFDYELMMHSRCLCV